jgi:alpha-glucoside transport system permease protein
MNRIPAGRFVARRPRLGLGRIVLTGVVIGICVLWSLPTLGLFVSSFRSQAAMADSGWWEALLRPLEAGGWTLRNYADVLTREGMGEAFVNSLVVTIPSTLLPITVAAFAAYGFAWLRFPARRLIFGAVIALLVVPVQMTLVPLLRLYVDLGLTGTFPGIWLLHTGIGLPLAIYLLSNAISQLPGELIEAAAIDGASHRAIFVRIVLPLVRPALASFAIFQFLWIWNDLLVALVFLGTDPAVAVLPAAPYQLIGTRGEAWYVLTAGAFVTMVLPLAVFLALQRAFVRGIVAGSLQG